MRKPGVYFAHAMSDYGTEWEKRAEAYIQRVFREYTILNPNKSVHQKGWKEQGMRYFDSYFLPKAQALVYTPFPDYRIGAGVAYEILHFQAKGLSEARWKCPIFELDRNLDSITKVNPAKIAWRFIDRIETRAAIRAFRNQ